jgi:hypothetical protein
VRPAAGHQRAEHQDDGRDGGGAPHEQGQRTTQQRLAHTRLAGAQPQHRGQRDEDDRDEEVRRDRPRVEAGEHGDPAEQRLRGDAEEGQDGERAQVSALRPPHRDDGGDGDRGEDEGEQPVAELDDAVAGQLGGGDEALAGAPRPGRAAQARAREPDGAAGDDDGAVRDGVGQGEP